MRVLGCGERAALVEVDGLAQVLGLHAALSGALPDGVLELVPAARTVLLRYDPRRTSLERLRATVSALSTVDSGQSAGAEVTVPVRYDGPDLADVARLTGRTEREVVERHLAGRYTVAFCGFSPGFGYLTGLDPALHVPRRGTPRTRVRAGAVALADAYTAIYPRESPGGWQLIGRTDHPVWDLDRPQPALLPPGTTVHFVESRA